MALFYSYAPSRANVAACFFKISIHTKGIFMTREKHLTWCKQRALEYVNAGDIGGGLASMFSDLRKHDETQDHPAIMLGAMLMMSGHLSTEEQAKDFIDGFN